jgi:beta-glucanase (GH16 family)
VGNSTWNVQEAATETMMQLKNQKVNQRSFAIFRLFSLMFVFLGILYVNVALPQLPMPSGQSHNKNLIFIPYVDATLLMPSGQSDTWNLIFNEEFDGTSINTSKWTTCYWWDDYGCTNVGNNELQWYLSDDVLVNNGTLMLRAQERTVTAKNGKTYGYTSGMITTGRHNWQQSSPTRFVFQYGYAEIRAKVPAGKGLWPAFWMLPEDHDSLPEIDVMEVLGHEPNTVHMNFHYQKEDGSYDKEDAFWSGPNLSTGWHTFAVDWQPNAIIWYIDGTERWRYTDAANIPAEPMYLLVNLAVGGDWPGAPDTSTPLPSYYEVDYVRVWSKRGIPYP